MLFITIIVLLLVCGGRQRARVRGREREVGETDLLAWANRMLGSLPLSLHLFCCLHVWRRTRSLVGSQSMWLQTKKRSLCAALVAHMSCRLLPHPVMLSLPTPPLPRLKAASSRVLGRWYRMLSCLDLPGCEKYAARGNFLLRPRPRSRPDT